MAQTVAEKPQYTFNRGYITEQSPVAVAEGSALDMENFEIDVTGGLRRRRAIAQEAGGNNSTLSLGDRAGDEVFTRYVWRNAGGVASRVVQVFQLGQYVSFVEDSEVLGASEPFAVINLEDFATESATPEMIRTTNASFADGRSHLFVVTENTTPFYVALSGDEVTVVPMTLRMRDFVGIVDGVANTTQPVVLTTAHRYNLHNRGWTTTEMNDYFDDKAKYPAKNMTSNLGYKRVVDVTTQEGFGTKEWNSDKMEAEVFRDASAPQGSLLQDPFDTTVAYGNIDPVTGSSSNIAIDTWAFVEGIQTIVTVNTDGAHGLTSGDEVSIDNNVYSYLGFTSGGIPFFRNGTLDGTYIIEVVDTDTITFAVPDNHFPGFASFTNQYVSKGSVQVALATGGGSVVPSPEGYITDKRPAVTAWYAGRVWFMGTPHEKLIDTVLFSQIAEGPHQYGLAHQANDPTAEVFNALSPADGGTIRIAGLHGVKGATVLGASLIICAQSGIWEIRGGSNAGFTADNFLVRKVSDAECTSMVGIARTDTSICVATKRGIFAVGFDTNSGLVNAVNLTVARVNTYWNTIPESKLNSLRLDYDDAKKRMYALISKETQHTRDITYVPPANVYTEALVLDFRIGEGGAFYKLSMPLALAGDDAGYIGGLTVLDGADNSSSNRKVKYVYVRTATDLEDVVAFCDTENQTFTDISGDEHVPFFQASYDNTGDWHKRKRAANFVYMFMGRTETGYEAVGDEVAPINPGSVFLQGRWEWADSGNSGKWSNPVQVYRPRGIYNLWTTPEVGNQSGYPVVVTRNKLRGSGRALSLYVNGEEGKDAHILGWLIQYGVG